MQRYRIIWIIVFVTFGISLGIGAFTMHYAKGLSYLSNDSSSCANCHIMREHYSAWSHSSHKSVAQCNDCHTPRGFIAKYLTKASNGYWHSLAFTTGNHPDPIRIKNSNLQIAEASCRSCHNLVQHYSDEQTSGLQCTRCHAGVGHMIR